VRTTLTLEEDVAKLIEQEVKRSGEPFKTTINRLLRAGLSATRQPRKSKPFKVKPIAMGLREGLSYDSVSTLLEEAEGPWHR
jgi:hypothetical protein